MKIKICEDAVNRYVESHTDFDGIYYGEDNWETIMSKIAGKFLEVDTEMLFKYEFNTKPIKGVSKEGLRISEDYVIEIVDDIRHGKARCDFCNSVSDSVESCTKCGRTDYLDIFFEDEY